LEEGKITSGILHSCVTFPTYKEYLHVNIIEDDVAKQTEVNDLIVAELDVWGRVHLLAVCSFSTYYMGQYCHDAVVTVM